MLDRYDIFYGISKDTKEKLLYWIYSTLFSFIVLLWINDQKGFLFIKTATNSREFFSLLLSVFFLGLIMYFIAVNVLIYKDIKRFKKRDKTLFIYTRFLNDSQKVKVLKKIYVRKYLYTLLSGNAENQEVTLSEQQWKYYHKKLGTPKTLILKLKFLHLVEKKIKEEEPLKDKEIDFVNTILFSKEDLELLRKLEKDVKNKRIFNKIFGL
ncbi:hypothetical protein [Priestia megaterium]|uniref:Uncharacterized protein n=1 Tax=Priestia megaterium TaxID=1404 RepID=A0A6M6E0Y0_PRIMG|nr:hypothetical protein [Priestia megaterium]QJX80703.1 hypothetical protein FDZ14_31940 [Priestia megaterium]